MSDKVQTKVAVSVAEMARMVGLSRARFYQLIDAGVFPPPERHAQTGRPFYTEYQQNVILEVRRRNCGVNGQPVLFNANRVPTRPQEKRGSAASKMDTNTGLLDAIKALGLTTATLAQVTMAVAELYPNGTVKVELGEVVRAVFLHLKRRATS